MNEILKLLETIKEKIELVENGDESKELLDEIRSLFVLFIEKSQLILISHKEVYYGYFLLNMETEVDFYENILAAVSFENNPVKFISNPLLLCKMSLPEILFVICHEIDHILYNHPSDFARFITAPDSEKHYKFNLAADAAINDNLRSEIKIRNLSFLKVPESSVTSEVISDITAKFNEKTVLRRNMNWLYYYSAIKDLDFSLKLDFGLFGGGGGNLNGYSVSGKKQVVTEKNCGKTPSHSWNKKAELPEIQEKIKDFLNSVNESLPDNVRGELPSNFEKQIEIINKPAMLPWSVILKRLIGTVNSGKRKTKTRLNRRQPTRFDLSGEMSDKILKLVVAIDTSGSMSEEMISDVFNEIFEIIKKRRFDLTIIECDAELQKVYKVRKRDDIETTVIGAGGTSFTPVIEYLNNNKYYRNAVLIYFTDGFGEYEIPKPLTYKNIWVISGEKENLSLSEPYGVVIGMDSI